MSADGGRKPEDAEGFVQGTLKPELRLQEGDLPATTRELRDHLARSGKVFDRDGPVLVVPSLDGDPPSVRVLTFNNVVIEAHNFCQPVRWKANEKAWVPTTLPTRVASMYLDMVGEWDLAPLRGVSTAPLLSDDGTMRTASGYDARTGLWCSGIPEIGPMIPMTPTRDQADAALRVLRDMFKTFPFGDAERTDHPLLGIELVDGNKPPGMDESALLVALLTAACRPSLPLAPGLLVNAPAISGAGCGKGLLVRAISDIAFNVRPRAFTAGSEGQELDKRLVAEFIGAHPVVFLDNANGRVLNSDTLASLMTERRARVRILGESRMVEINSTSFIAATGNALLPSGDLARPFIECRLDARCEDPEARPFRGDFLETVRARHKELLVSVLTIWRWGRQNSPDLAVGKALGSFEEWASWCRDPLVALGCRDPVLRIAEAKKRDPRRQDIVALFDMWWRHHGSGAVKASKLAAPVTQILDPQSKGRQYVAHRLNALADTRAGGFLLTQVKPTGSWGATTYALMQTTLGSPGSVSDRDHRAHERPDAGAAEPKTPMPPMPEGGGTDLKTDAAVEPGEERVL